MMEGKQIQMLNQHKTFKHQKQLVWKDKTVWTKSQKESVYLYPHDVW